MTVVSIDDEVSLADAEREPYREPRPLPPPHRPSPGKIVVAGGKGRKRYYDPWPEPPQEYAWTADELESQRVAALASRPGKTRTGGFHSDVREGEVGPCTRCGWVWYPMAKSLRRSDFPHRCSNCRTPDWRIAPVYPERDEAYHYAKSHTVPYARCQVCHPARPAADKWQNQQAKRLARKRKKKAMRLAQLAEELGKQIVDASLSQAEVDSAFTQPIKALHPPMRPGHVIPPPPGMEDGE